MYKIYPCELFYIFLIFYSNSKKKVQKLHFDPQMAQPCGFEACNFFFKSYIKVQKLHIFLHFYHKFA